MREKKWADEDLRKKIPSHKDKKGAGETLGAKSATMWRHTGDNESSNTGVIHLNLRSSLTLTAVLR